MRLLSAKISEIAGADHHKSRKHRSSTTARAPASSTRAVQHAPYSCSSLDRCARIDHRRLLVRQFTSLRFRQSRRARPMGICSSCLGGRRTSESDVSLDTLPAPAPPLFVTLTFSRSTRTPRTCSETSTSPTTVPPIAPTTRPSPTQRSFGVSERTWSVSVPRQMSEFCLPYSLASQAIALSPS
jgi:hypothetical protein